MKKRIYTIKVGKCTSCNKEAEMGTAHFGSDFMHEFKRVPKKCGGKLNYIVYCGYGSIYDGLYIGIKTETNLDNVLLCNEHLKEFLSGGTFCCFKYMFHDEDGKWGMVKFGKRKLIYLPIDDKSNLPENLFH